MKAVIQRVLKAKLNVDNTLISEINKGFIVFLGVEEGDSEKELVKIATKISKLRIFEDINGKMNLGIKEVNGEILLVSQFTLLGDCKGCNRPSFIKAEKPEKANLMYQSVGKFLENEQIKVKYGVFGADMKINVLNDGPVTIILDSEKI